MDIDIDVLIEEVEMRPALYNPGLSEYNDNNEKKILWEEICTELCSRWETLNLAEKKRYVQVVQKKWRSLRDCFRREVYNQQSFASGSVVKKKATYKYYDSLLFLMPFTQLTEKEPTPDGLDTGNPINGACVNENKTKGAKENATRSNGSIIVKKKIESMITNDENDDDKLFLLSLLPSFKDCDMEEKFSLRIQIMQTIMNFKQSTRAQENRNLGEMEADVTIDIKPFNF